MIRKKGFGVFGFEGWTEDANEQELERLVKEDGRLFDKDHGDKDGSAEQPLSPSFISEDKKHSDGEKIIFVSPEGQLPAAVYSKSQAKECDDGTEIKKEGTPSTSGHGSRRKKRGGIYVAVIAICMLLSVILLMFDISDEGEEISGVDTEEKVSEESDVELTDIQIGAEAIYSSRKNSSVTVLVYLEDGVEYLSGTVVMDGGYVVTVCDNVHNARKIEIVSADGDSRVAALLGYDTVADIALLSCDGDGLVPALSPEEYTFRAGDRLYAIGTAGDARFGGSLFEGVVSFEERTVEVFDQSGTRRAITVGMGGAFCDTLRGCPVYDEQGSAVAMIWGRTSDSVGLIVPLSRVVAVAKCFREGDAPDSEILACIAFGAPSLGVIGENYSDGEVSGVLIKDFSSALCDSALKLRRDDVLVRIDGSDVKSTRDVKQKIYEYRAGDIVEVYVLRNSQLLSFFVELD